jgi:hypothetical protein
MQGQQFCAAAGMKSEIIVNQGILILLPSAHPTIQTFRSESFRPINAMPSAQISSTAKRSGFSRDTNLGCFTSADSHRGPK